MTWPLNCILTRSVIVISLFIGSCPTRLWHDPHFFPPALFALVVLFFQAQASAESRIVAPGIEYTVHRLLDPNAVHVLAIDRNAGWQFSIGFPEGKRHFKQKERTGEIFEEYDEPPCFDVFAALNASFFQVDGTGIEGALASQGDLIQAPSNHTETLAISTDGEWSVVDHASLTSAILQTPKGESVQVDRVNEVRLPETLALYTEVWGASTETTQPGVEVVVEPVAGDAARLESRSGTVTSIHIGPDALGNAIPPDGFVLSARGAKAQWLERSIRPRDRLSATFTFNPKQMALADLLLGVKGWLVKEGQLNRPAWNRYRESFTSKRHPRSCLAWNEERLYLVVVDGRQVASWGMTFEELALFARDVLGAEEAVNLDGGGSSTLVVEGEIMNQPSDPQGERPVGNALLVWRQAAGSDGECE